MPVTALHNAITSVPPGPWAVGVSGGADSVALLLLLHDRPNLQLHVVHLDHQTREGESTVDAQFVEDLAKQSGLACSIGLRSDIETRLPQIAANLPDRYRQARLAFFRAIVDREKLQGVILAHHADDQAETIAMRLLRHAGIANLRPIQPVSIVNGLQILRPLLEIHATDLRSILTAKNQPWREDASNQSDKYQRNRIRHWLANQPDLRGALIDLGKQSDALRTTLESISPSLAARFHPDTLSKLPAAFARHSVARWLIDHGAPVSQINRQTCDRLLEMANDAASPARQHFPGGLSVRRRRGEIFVDRG
jgi:tRNA(Ile)-lysidine synthetase-like protein